MEFMQKEHGTIVVVGEPLGEPILLVKKILITTFLLLIKTLSQLMNFTDMELELERLVLIGQKQIVDLTYLKK